MKILGAFVTSLALILTGQTDADAKTKAASPAYEQALQDIDKTFGFLPHFFTEFPAAALPGAWEDMKGIGLSEGAIPAKYKELIGLAVAGQAPCKYCTYFHTEAAKLSGASQDEIREAVTLSGMTRRWSTILNGHGIPFEAFTKQVDEIMTFLKAPAKKRKVSYAAAKSKNPKIKATLRDAAETLGQVPGFLTLYPPKGVSGAWREMKELQLGETHIPGKYKQLLELAVSSQIPCRYCVYFHTAAARLNGATDEEIGEAVAIAALVRHWSAFLNGAQINETLFRTDVDKIMNNMRTKSKTTARK